MMIYGNTIKDIIKMYPKWVWAGNILVVDSILFYPMLFFIGLAILFLFDI